MNIKIKKKYIERLLNKKYISISVSLIAAVVGLLICFCRRKFKEQKQQTILKSIHKLKTERKPKTESKQYENIHMSVRKTLHLHDLNDYPMTTDSDCSEDMFSF